MSTGRPAAELNIVSARVLEAHPVFERQLLDLQGREGGRLELREAPFVGIGDETERLRTKHLVGEFRAARRLVHLLVRNQQPLVHQLRIEPRGKRSS